MQHVLDVPRVSLQQSMWFSWCLAADDCLSFLPHASAFTAKTSCLPEPTVVGRAVCGSTVSMVCVVAADGSVSFRVPLQSQQNTGSTRAAHGQHTHSTRAVWAKVEVGGYPRSVKRRYHSGVNHTKRKNAVSAKTASECASASDA